MLTPRSLRGSHLITLTPPRPESVPALLGLFHAGIGIVEGFQWLPRAELVEAISKDDAADRFIGGSVDLKAKTLTLLRRNITPVFAPFSIFSKAGDGTTPDFTSLAVTDYGHTIALGKYISSTRIAAIFRHESYTQLSRPSRPIQCEATTRTTA